ncbi:AAA family ATPase [Shewanella indica]|uniref:AAA family ATPase n=1 Tax=Shewanella indica TaxID=768528 RepID=UPI003D36D36A
MNQVGTLIFFCGKMGAGKSTLSQELVSERRAVCISEDQWLAALFPQEIQNFGDYLKFSARLKPVMSAHIQALLGCGVDVVLDFPANTAVQRRAFKALAEAAGAQHLLVYLEADDELCLERLALRRVQCPERAAFDNETVFRQVSAYFEAPTAEEALSIEVRPA